MPWRCWAVVFYYYIKTISMSINFRHSICEPLNPVVLEKGALAKEQILPLLAAFPWRKYLLEMQQAEEQEIHFSPSLEIEHQSSGQGIVVSAVGEPDDFEFYIFYKRPKDGDPEFISNLTEQTVEDAKTCIEALIEGDAAYLEEFFAEPTPISSTQPIAPLSTSPKKTSFWARLKQLFS